MSWAKYKRLSSSKDLSIFRRGTTASDGGGGGGGNDPDAQAYIDALDAAGYTVSAFQETAINDLVLGLKAENIYSINWSGYTPGAGVAIIDALYPYIGSASSPCGINLADPRDLDAAYRATFVGGWTFGLSGAQPNGINGYHRTYLTDALLSATTERWFGLGSATDANPGAWVDGGKGTSQITRMQTRSGGSARLELYSNQVTSVVSDSLGNHLGYRTPTGGGIKLRKNGSLIIDTTSSTGGLSIATEYLVGATNNTNSAVISPFFYSGRLFSYWVFGRNYITDAQSISFQSLMDAFNTALGR